VYLQARGGTPFYEIASESLIPWIKKQDTIFQEEKRRATEHNVLAQLESANTEELSQILRRPSADEERLLEFYFGADRLQRLRSLALGARRRAVPKGNVVVLHGMVGGGLSVFPTNENSQFIWLNFPRLAIGAVGWLRMTEKFESQFDVRATGIPKKWYSKQLLGLAADGWNVQAFWYDWRQDLARIADSLRQQIDRWFGSDATVNLVAHSMGGLVARTYILRHAQRWGNRGRLIMLGTPNHGSFAIPQMITGAYDTIRKLAIVDVTHSLRELCDILNGFPGSMQMLPSPFAMKTMERMYDAALWSTWGVPQKILDIALASHERLANVVDGSRMSYIAGCNQVTKVGVRDWFRLDRADGYADSLEGDGTVPHALGFLREGRTRIPTYFVECSHGELPNHDHVIEGTKQILATGKCSLPTSIPRAGGAASVAASAAARHAREQAEEQALHALSRRVRGRSRAAGDIQRTPLSRDEIVGSEMLVRSFLGEASVSPAVGMASPSPGTPPSAATSPTVEIAIRLVRGRIEEIAAADAIAVGHYVGVTPQDAELAIDWAISKARNGKKEWDGKLLITDLCRRGMIVGVLGQNFILPDPRKPGRVIVIAGMGQPGTFRAAELAILSRILVWTLGRSGCKNLASVLIGAGAGNLETLDAVDAWLRGVRRALHDAQAASEARLRSITFVEFSHGKFVRMHHSLKKAVVAFAKDSEIPLKINYSAPTDAALREAEREAAKAAAQRASKEERKSFTALTWRTADAEPMRLTIQLQADTFQFAALTAQASIPQRDTRIDPALVEKANDALPAAESFAKQLDHGILLGRLLLPRDMRDMILQQTVPIVLALDASTARIHWEMVAAEAAGSGVDFNPDRFLGTFYGLTRQLRTTFAQLAEPLILTERPLRVLVVADPAEDAPLPGAQEEGEAVAAIFDEFGPQSGRKVEVVRLFGPGQATRVSVLDHLINQRFDMMHYAGHCFFNKENPPLSGWIFTGQKVLSANELTRVDRIPRFIFSNACESGITPDRADKRTALMAPSFAEAFFARGVANFVCTAWPIDDSAALDFARRFYRGILGLRGEGVPAESLNEAMREARREVARLGPGGMQTWGAYQHYGDPNLRLIPRGAQTRTAEARVRKSAGPTWGKRRQRRKK
jgi:pimeloyl-ACP methyl ester carboxylesterase